ncbi:ecotropic viral integration site 5 protein homolog, partial [Diaphorina citri]|uniref:Ecotropic viral integration site 5 protein homolog n=1 Tax=Diaphorina citri TaxID=121845 RepID=A0A1S4EPJ6_DIACI
VALALLGIGKEALLSLDMEGMLKYFQKELPLKADADPDALMQAAYKISYNTKKMKKMEKEYTVMKTKEQEEMIELKYFQKELPLKADADPDALMQAAYKISYNTKKMKKMEKEYTVMKNKEQEEMIELKVI